MSLRVVEERLDSLLTSPVAKVMLLTGGWGAGKTHQWKQALHRASSKGVHPKHAYISLFGLATLSEVRRRVAEEVISIIRLPGKTETVAESLNIEKGFKPLQALKLLPIIPYLGKLEGLANELSFNTVRNAVICFDDLERAGKQLPMTDIIGLASFLKEERNCRVILISNDAKLNKENKDELSLYMEKVIDEKIHFKPTPEEACQVAIPMPRDEAMVELCNALLKLEISNIRVISRLRRISQELVQEVRGLHSLILQDCMSALALFGAANFLPTDGFPTPAFLFEWQNDISRYFDRDKPEDQLSEQDKREASWRRLLEKYGYGYTSAVDAEIGRAVEQGYFDRESLRKAAIELSENFESNEKREAVAQALQSFWGNISGDSHQILALIREKMLDAMPILSAGELHSTYDVFVQVGQNTVAEELLEAFIAANQHKPQAFAMDDGPFKIKRNVAVNERLASEFKKFDLPEALDTVLDRINFNQGWNGADVRRICDADFSEITSLVMNSGARIFRARVRTLLRIGQHQNASDEEKLVTSNTIRLLGDIGRSDPLLKVRLGSLLPEDEGQ